jgi:hypothetical protein
MQQRYYESKNLDAFDDTVNLRVDDLVAIPWSDSLNGGSETDHDEVDDAI